jgi:hypothetical protein
MRKYLLLYILLLFSRLAFSQSEYGYLTIEYGKNYSWFKYTNETKDFNQEFLAYPTWHIGYEYPVSKKFSLGLGTNFIRRGAKLEEEYQSYHIQADYIDIYFNLSFYYLGQKKLLQPYFFIEPGWGTCIGGEIYNSLEKPYTTSLNTTNFRKFNFSFNYGLGLDAKIPTGKLGIEVSQDIGLSNTYSDNDFYDYQGEMRKNRSYLFKIKYCLDAKYLVILFDEISYAIWKLRKRKYYKSVRSL